MVGTVFFTVNLANRLCYETGYINYSVSIADSVLKKKLNCKEGEKHLWVLSIGPIKFFIEHHLCAYWEFKSRRSYRPAFIKYYVPFYMSIFIKMEYGMQLKENPEWFGTL